MNIKQTIRNFSAGLLVLLGLAVFVMPANTYAAKCGNVETSIISCTQDNTGNDVKNTGLWGILLIAINILTAGVGVVAVGGIVYGSILYTTAGGSQEKIKKATTVFTNVVIGVIAFAGMYALLNFIIPGGIFN